MIRVTVISAVLLLMTAAQSTLAMSHSFDPKLGPAGNKYRQIAISQKTNKDTHVCPFAKQDYCAGGGLVCNTNPRQAAPVFGSPGNGVL